MSQSLHANLVYLYLFKLGDRLLGPKLPQIATDTPESILR